MSRRDIIIISVLVNAGLLMVLFVSAIKTESGDLPFDDDFKLASIETVQPAKPLEIAQPLDEVDHVLKEYFPDLSSEDTVSSDIYTALNPPETVQKQKDDFTDVKTVEVTVKSGDALEKIARANHTTIEAIRKINQLKTDKLKIGQVLKIPVGTVKEVSKPVAKTEPVKKEQDEIVYYTVKSGDNPWKIAKQYQVKFEDLLKLNNLDEERAKNLKIGERIRVR